MSNELNNIISQHTDGVFEGVAIGGDRYPGSVYLDHLLRYENDDRVKMMVMLGEVRMGGIGGLREWLLLLLYYTQKYMLFEGSMKLCAIHDMIKVNIIFIRSSYFHLFHNNIYTCLFVCRLVAH
jgi:hypothetical protein